MSAETRDGLAEALAPAVYEAYRLGKYGQQQYLPMWHEDGAREHVPGVEVNMAADAARAHIASVLADEATVEVVADVLVMDPILSGFSTQIEPVRRAARAVLAVLTERIGGA
jgi:hypothetical protein